VFEALEGALDGVLHPWSTRDERAYVILRYATWREASSDSESV